MTKPIAVVMVLGVSLLALTASSNFAHASPWRAGEPRLAGFGHCAKGPCMKRIDWSESKPHCHIARSKYLIGREARCGKIVR